MKFHKIVCEDNSVFITPNLTTTFPTWQSGDEGRLLFSYSVGRLYLGGRTNWEQIWTSLNDGHGSGLDADLLDGQQGSYYRDASNMNAGILPAARLSGLYTINIQGDADTLDGQHGTYYRNASNMNAGILPAARLSGVYNITATAARYS